jgi:hypothetical protein
VVADDVEGRQRRRKMLAQRRGELVGMKDRLLSAFLAAAADEAEKRGQERMARS